MIIIVTRAIKISTYLPFLTVFLSVSDSEVSARIKPLLD